MEALFIAILLLVTVLDASTSTSMTRTVLEEIFGSSNGSIRDDDYSVVNEADEWTFTVESQAEIALSDFFKSAAPSLADFLKGLAMPSLLALPLEFFRYNKSCRELEVRSSADGESEIVDEFLTIFDVSVYVKVKVSDDDPNSRFYLIHSAAMGTWKVGDVHLTLDITEANRKYVISGNIPELDVTAFLRSLGKDPLPSGESGKALSERGFSTVRLKSIEIKGLYEPISGNFSLCFSGTPSIENWDKLVMHVVYYRYEKGSQTAITIAVEVKEFGLADVVSKISDLDIRGIPSLGLQSNVGVLISTDDVNTNFLPDSIGGILREALPFREGVVVIAQLMLSKSYSAKFIIQITSDGFTMRSRTPLSVGEAASAFGFATESIVLPPGIKDIVSLTVESLTYNKVTKKITASFPLKTNIDLIHDWVKIDDAYANVTFTTTSPVKKNFIYYGKWTMGSTTFDVKVKALPGGYGLSGSGKAMTMQDLLSENQCNFLPGGISLGVLDSLRIVNPSLSVVTEERSIDLWGDAHVGDWVDVSIDVVCESGTSGLRAALGLYVSNKKFSTVLGKFVGQSLGFLDLLGGVDVAVAVSSADFEGRTFKGSKMKQLSYIKKGVTVAALVKIPENTNDPLLKLIRSGFGDDFNFQIRARLSNARDMSVYAGFANMQLSSAITLQTLGLEYELKEKKTAIYLWAELLLKNPELLFVAVIKKSSDKEVEVLAQMVGVWERAFGIDWLSFGNLHFFIKFIPGATPTGFEIGGEIHIGEPGSEEQIKGAAYFGLDAKDPENNYFYARVNKLTLQGIVDVLGVDLQLPEFLGTTGFPEGLLVSHALKEKAVAGITIPKGTRIKGTLDIFGLRVKGDIQLSSTLVKIDLEMSPIELAGGLIKVYASEYDRSRGPRLRVDVSAVPPRAYVHARAYAQILGFLEKEAYVQMDEDQYLFVMRGYLGPFESNLKVQALNPTSVSDASFRVYGSYSTEWLNRIGEVAAKKIEDLGRSAERGLIDAQEALRRAEGKLNDAQREMDKIMHKIDNICTIHHCGTVTIKCPRFECCWHVWGGCGAYGLCGFYDCDITDPVCILRNAGCTALRETLKAPFRLAKETLEGAKYALRAAIGLLEAAKQITKIGVRALSWLSRNALTGLINLKLLTFDVEIGRVKDAKFDFQVIVSFLRMDPIGFRISANVRDLWDLIISLFEKAKSYLVDNVKSFFWKVGGLFGKRSVINEIEYYRKRSAQEPVQPNFEEEEKQVEADFTNATVALENQIEDDSASIGQTDEGGVDTSQAPGIDGFPDDDEGICERFKNFFRVFIRDIAYSLEALYRSMGQRVMILRDKLPILRQCTDFLKERENVTADEETENLSKEVEEKARQVAKLQEDLKNMKKKLNEDKDEMPTEEDDSSSLDGGVLTVENIEIKIKEGDEQDRNDTLRRKEKEKEFCHKTKEVVDTAASHLQQDNLKEVNNVLKQIDRLCVKAYGKDFSTILDQQCGYFLEKYEKYSGPHKENAQKVKVLIEDMCERLGYKKDRDEFAKKKVLDLHAIFVGVHKDLESSSILRVFCPT